MGAGVAVVRTSCCGRRTWSTGARTGSTRTSPGLRSGRSTLAPRRSTGGLHVQVASSSSRRASSAPSRAAARGGAASRSVHATGRRDLAGRGVLRHSRRTASAWCWMEREPPGVGRLVLRESCSRGRVWCRSRSADARGGRAEPRAGQRQERAGVGCRARSAIRRGRSGLAVPIRTSEAIANLWRAAGRIRRSATPQSAARVRRARAGLARVRRAVLLSRTSRAGAVAGPQEGRRAGVADLHQRHHRHAQGRDAHAQELRVDGRQAVVAVHAAYRRQPAHGAAAAPHLRVLGGLPDAALHGARSTYLEEIEADRCARARGRGRHRHGRRAGAVAAARAQDLQELLREPAARRGRVRGGHESQPSLRDELPG